MKERASKFWEWFHANSSAYLFLAEVDEALKSTLLDDLKQHLHEYCDKLSFEIGGDPESDQELIITAEGQSAYFEYAEALITEAPRLDRWRFYSLIPPRGSDFEISIEGSTFRTRDMWFQPMGHPAFPEITGIRVCIPTFEAVKDKEWIHPAISKMVEYILGEKTFALSMHYIEVGELPEVPIEWGMIPLANLERFVQWRQAKALELIHSN